MACKKKMACGGSSVKSAKCGTKTSKKCKK